MTTVKWLLYTSRINIPPDRVEAELAGVVARSCDRNLAGGVSGAMIATTTRVAQYVEGPDEAVADLMRRIEPDPRHAELQIVAAGERRERQFPGWGMHYVGGSVFVQRRIADAIEDSTMSGLMRADRLIALMREFARPGR
jgi:hypothetical protein